MATDKLTPMMRQFYELKAKYPDAIMLFRCGDFYETYSQDAVEAASILGITLTRRNYGTKSGDQVEMAGFPFHALDVYLPRLVRSGRRVAICDQLENPKFAKKLVKRGITELVTPGVVLSDNVLLGKENNFVSSIHFGKGCIGVAFLDISTGEFITSQGSCAYVEKLLGSFEPKEVLYERGKNNLFKEKFGEKFFTFEMDDWAFTERSSRTCLLRQFDTENLKGFGIDEMTDAIIAAGVILQYLKLTCHNNISHITSISRIDDDRFVRLDKFTIRNLEIITPVSNEGKSLLNVLDKTITPGGARKLRRWLLFPLKDLKEIKHRSDIVDFFYKNHDIMDQCGRFLQSVGDLERIMGKISGLRATPRDMMSLKVALDVIEPIKDICNSSKNETIKSLGNGLDPCADLRNRIANTLQTNPPLSVSRGGVIAEGVDKELDDLRRIAYDGKNYLIHLQQKEIEQTGIPNIKIAYNSVFGYYLEVRNTHRDKVPNSWIRKQTLVGAERYITSELKEYEEKILTAQDKILDIETRLFGELVTEAATWTDSIQRNAALLSDIDVLLSLAYVAIDNDYTRPELSEEKIIDICSGRHPVIETMMPIGEHYIPNDVLLDCDTQQIVVITGPNMAGKSAFLRQTALITLLAQIGSFVPAKSARIGIVDKIFTRVGAGDNISVGESTFMVEMTEAANILNNLTPRSLVLFDELGRGTSTYDGISLAWAIVEHIHEHSECRCRTLFATHYHELNEMENLFPRIKNYNVSVHEDNGKIIFLRQLKRGGCAHSFGINVARLAGIPRSIIDRAKTILADLEATHTKDIYKNPEGIKKILPTDGGLQLNIFQLDDPVLSEIRKQILTLDINSLTPLEALNQLNDIKKILTG